jgi:hypothetical protein
LTGALLARQRSVHTLLRLPAARSGRFAAKGLGAYGTAAAAATGKDAKVCPSHPVAST